MGDVATATPTLSDVAVTEILQQQKFQPAAPLVGLPQPLPQSVLSGRAVYLAPLVPPSPGTLAAARVDAVTAVAVSETAANGHDDACIDDSDSDDLMSRAAELAAAATRKQVGAPMQTPIVVVAKPAAAVPIVYPDPEPRRRPLKRRDKTPALVLDEEDEDAGGAVSPPAGPMADAPPLPAAAPAEGEAVPNGAPVDAPDAEHGAAKLVPSANDAAVNRARTELYESSCVLLAECRLVEGFKLSTFVRTHILPKYPTPATEKTVYRSFTSYIRKVRPDLKPLKQKQSGEKRRAGDEEDGGSGDEEAPLLPPPAAKKRPRANPKQLDATPVSAPLPPPGENGADTGAPNHGGSSRQQQHGADGAPVDALFEMARAMRELAAAVSGHSAFMREAFALHGAAVVTRIP